LVCRYFYVNILSEHTSSLILDAFARLIGKDSSYHSDIIKESGGGKHILILT